MGYIESSRGWGPKYTGPLLYVIYNSFALPHRPHNSKFFIHAFFAAILDVQRKSLKPIWIIQCTRFSIVYRYQWCQPVTFSVVFGFGFFNRKQTILSRCFGSTLLNETGIPTRFWLFSCPLPKYRRHICMYGNPFMLCGYATHPQTHQPAEHTYPSTYPGTHPFALADIFRLQVLNNG